MIFPHRLILLATPRQIGVLDWRPGRLHWLGEFVATAAGLAAFQQIIAKHAHLPTLLVVDSVDEDYRGEILPHVSGRARDEMLARKLKQVFRNARFTGAWLQGRETGGRRDDRYLLAALSDADWLTPWLSVLDREQVPLYGVAPLALAYQHMLVKLRMQDAHVMLACRLNNSLRLSYYHNGQLRFSRLIGGETPTQLPGNGADDIAKTQLYLTGQRILPREARLRVLLLDPGGQLNSAQAPLNADPAFSARLLDLNQLGRALRIPSAFLAATPEIAPLAAIAGEPMLLNLAPPELLRRYREFHWRRSLAAAAAGVALVGVGVSGAYWLHAQRLGNEAQALAATHAQVRQQHQAVVDTFPRQTAAPEALAQSVALARQLAAPQPDSAHLLGAVGQALETLPEFSLDGLSWQAEAVLPSGAYTVHLDATLTPFDGNYRAALQRIDRLTSRLQLAPGVSEVKLRNSPVNTDPSGTLIGKTLTPDASNKGELPFGISFVFREADA